MSHPCWCSSEMESVLKSKQPSPVSSSWPAAEVALTNQDAPECVFWPSGNVWQDLYSSVVWVQSMPRKELFWVHCGKTKNIGGGGAIPLLDKESKALVAEALFYSPGLNVSNLQLHDIQIYTVLVSGVSDSCELIWSQRVAAVPHQVSGSKIQHHHCWTELCLSSVAWNRPWLNTLQTRGNALYSNEVCMLEMC